MAILNLVVEDIEVKHFPVTIEGQDTGGCQVVLRPASNTKKYTMCMSENKISLIETLFLEHFVRFEKPFNINGQIITPEDIINRPIFAQLFDDCIAWILKSYDEPAKN